MSATDLRAAIEQLDAALDAVNASPPGHFTKQAAIAQLALTDAYAALYDDATDRAVERALLRAASEVTT
jgi:hypothetical protein